ncbi:MAG: hypothetical protein GKR94_25415 [Gammaproteobacteria bacterium]|nr:hypothetical protein [Gammaproteobacteria bacterium]
MGLSAANALLKILEEPPGGTVFISITHRRSAVLPTIMSRCQRIDLPAPARKNALRWLHTQIAEERVEEGERKFKRPSGQHG